MSRTLLGALFVLTWPACSGGSRPPQGGVASNVSAGGASGSGGNGAASAVGSSSDGAAGMAGAGVDAGGDPSAGGVGGGQTDAGNPEPDVCGDGEVGPSEDCEPERLTASCVELGFDAGELGCSAECRFDTSGCTGEERCYDGIDNDGDARPDCLDSDCQAACSQSCASPPVLEDGGSSAAGTEGRASEIEASCSSSASIAELVYEFTAETSGKLDVMLRGQSLMTLSVRSACADDGSELVCAVIDQQGSVTLDIESGDTVYLVVEGYEEGTSSGFSLTALSRAADQCGDAFVDESEACDDGASADGDGCDANCQVESNEGEPNDTFEQASPVLGNVYALIDPEGDVDHFELTLMDGPSDVTIEVRSLGSGFCTDLRMDPYVELFDSQQNLVAANDDGGEGFCARLVAPGLAAGAYTIVVQESDAALDNVQPSFAYELEVSGN